LENIQKKNTGLKNDKKPLTAAGKFFFFSFLFFGSENLFFFFFQFFFPFVRKKIHGRFNSKKLTKNIIVICLFLKRKDDLLCKKKVKQKKITKK